MSKPANPFRYFNSSPEVIRLVVMMYVKYPLSLRNVEDLLAERGIYSVRHEVETRVYIRLTCATYTCIHPRLLLGVDQWKRVRRPSA
jgi:hypothetical protein